MPPIALLDASAGLRFADSPKNRNNLIGLCR
jgi:hypothetical protein